MPRCKRRAMRPQSETKLILLQALLPGRPGVSGLWTRSRRYMPASKLPSGRGCDKGAERNSAGWRSAAIQVKNAEDQRICGQYRCHVAAKSHHYYLCCRRNSVCCGSRLQRVYHRTVGHGAFRCDQSPAQGALKVTASSLVTASLALSLQGKDLGLRYGDNELTSPLADVTHLSSDFVLQVPWQDQQIVRPGFADFVR